ETGSVFHQGSAPVDVKITEDGRWTGTVGRASASGIARMRRGWLVLSGTETAADGHQGPVFSLRDVPAQGILKRPAPPGCRSSAGAGARSPRWESRQRESRQRDRLSAEDHVSNPDIPYVSARRPET